jgi:hypothetical protein
MKHQLLPRIQPRLRSRMIRQIMKNSLHNLKAQTPALHRPSTTVPVMMSRNILCQTTTDSTLKTLMSVSQFLDLSWAGDARIHCLKSASATDHIFRINLPYLNLIFPQKRTLNMIMATTTEEAPRIFDLYHPMIHQRIQSNVRTESDHFTKNTSRKQSLARKPPINPTTMALRNLQTTITLLTRRTIPPTMNPIIQPTIKRTISIMMMVIITSSIPWEKTIRDQ